MTWWLSIKLKVTSDASKVINDYFTDNANTINREELAIVIYRQMTRSWSGTFCQDLIQLTHKENVKNNERFENWTDIEENDLNLEFYIDKNFLNEIGHNGTNMIVDVKSWKVFRKQQHSLVLKIEA